MPTTPETTTKPQNALDQLLQFRLADWTLEFFEKSATKNLPPRFPTEEEFNKKFLDLFPNVNYEQTLISIQNIADQYKIADIGQNILVLRQIFSSLIENDLKELEISNLAATPIISKIDKDQTKLPTSGLATIEEVDAAIQKIRQEKAAETLPPAIELPTTIKINTPSQVESEASLNLPSSPQPIQQPITPTSKSAQPTITLPVSPSSSPTAKKPESNEAKTKRAATIKKLEDTVNLTHKEVATSIKQIILTPAISSTIFKAKIDTANQERLVGKISDTVASNIVYSTHTADYQELSPVIASEIYEAVAKEPETTKQAGNLVKSEEFLVAVDQSSEANFPAISQANVASQVLLINTLTNPKSAPTTHTEIIDSAVSTALKINPSTNTSQNKLVVSAAIQQVFLPSIAQKVLDTTADDFEKNIPLQPERFLQNLGDAQEQSFNSLLKHLDGKLEDKTLLTQAAPRFVTDTISREILQPINIYAQGQQAVAPTEAEAAQNHAFASLMENPKRQKEGYEDFLAETLQPSPQRQSFLSRSTKELKGRGSISAGEAILLKNYSDELELYEQIPQFQNPNKRSVWRMGGFSRSYYSQSSAGQTITRSTNFIPKKSYFNFSQKFSTSRAKGKLKGFAKKGAGKVAAKVGLSAALGAATGGTSLVAQVALALILKYKKKVAYIAATLAFLAYLFFLWLLTQIAAFVIGFAVGAAIGFALGGPVGALIGGFLGGTASVWLYSHFPPYAAFVDSVLLNLPKLWGAVTAPIGWVASAWGALSATASFLGGVGGGAVSLIGGGLSSLGGLLSSGASTAVSVATSPAILIPTATLGGVTAFSVLSYNTVSSALFTNPSLPEQIVLPGDATEGESGNTYIQIQKLVSAPNKSLGPAKTINLENSDLPQTTTYSVSITAGNQPVYDIVCSDTITHTTKNGTVRSLTPPTITCPATLSPNQSTNINYSLNIPNETIFEDSSISNKFSINFKSFDPLITPSPLPGGGFSNSVSSTANDLSSVFIGTPAGDCPSGWPVAGSGSVTQGPGANVSHQSLEAVDIGTFYTDSLLASFNGIIQYKYSDPNASHPITGRTGLTVILGGTCNGVAFQAIYGHLDSFGSGIEVGTVVTKGQVIGYEGYTGYILPPDIRGTHLHYEFRGLRMEPPYIPVDVRACAGSCARVN